MYVCVCEDGPKVCLGQMKDLWYFRRLQILNIFKLAVAHALGNVQSMIRIHIKRPSGVELQLNLKPIFFRGAYYSNIQIPKWGILCNTICSVFVWKLVTCALPLFRQICHLSSYQKNLWCIDFLVEIFLKFNFLWMFLASLTG